MAFSEVTNDIELLGPDKGAARGFTADEAITAGQVVKLGSDNGVEPSDTDGEQTSGIAVQTVAAGDEVMVAGPGSLVRFTAGEAVSQNEYLTSHGATGEEGEVATADATGDWIIGQAHESATDGNTFVGLVVAGGQVN